MIRLLLVRHGQSEWNVERRVQGQASGVRLTELGRSQAREVAALLAGRGATRLVASDLERAVETATIVGEAVGLPVETTPLLREQALGNMEGRLAVDLSELPVPDGSHMHDVRWGGGESVADVYERVRRFCDGLRADGPATVIVVSHGGPMRVLAALLAGLGHRDVVWTPVEHAAVVEGTLT